MIKKALLAAIALTSTTGAAHADDGRLSKPEGAGMLTGAAAGAIVGGPVGAFVGLMVGGIIGSGVDHAQQAEHRAQTIEDELLETRRELAQAGQRADADALFAALSQSMRTEVLFKTRSAQLEMSMQEQLAEFGKLLAGHPRLTVRLHGFADPRGKPESNLQLSLRRAEVVREALLSGGAAAEQVEVSAHGEELTTAAKNDVEAYAWERRVSLVILPNTSQVAQSR
jgi:outer membrane protein OmpA-like peptidoglycan-associated protein